jgi:DNA replication initiation complex subunit (GINS family)
MYDELTAAWLDEIKEADLCQFTSDFYERLANYMQRIKDETKMLEKKTIKANLLAHELQNVRQMVEELTWVRYGKIIEMIAEGRKPPAGNLSTEELQMVTEILPLVDSYHTFAANLLIGQVLPVSSTKANQKASLRFKREIPSIIGADMQSYGPFMPEDVASVPVENAKILVKQGLAELVQMI